MDIKKALGLALKKLRADSGISQEKFAMQIGMDRTYYASIETGKRNVSITNIEKIVDGFKLSLPEFFSLVDECRKSEGENDGN